MGGRLHSFLTLAQWTAPLCTSNKTLGGAQRKSECFREDRRTGSPVVQPAGLSIYQTELHRTQVKAFSIQVSLGVKPRHCVSHFRRFERTYCLAYLEVKWTPKRYKIRRRIRKRLTLATDFFSNFSRPCI